MEHYADHDARWEAVLNRKPDADGLFYYGVKSTGVFCRPTCPSRRPARQNVTFYETPDAAEEAGFRPCLRCRPTEPSTHQRVVVQVQHLLDTIDPPPSLTDLGAAVNLSPYHLQRLFKKATGLSPKEYAAARRTERLKQGLRQGSSVTSAMYDAGYGSVRALYDKAHEQLGMSPGAYKNGGHGIAIKFALRDSPIGRMLIAATARGVCAVRFGEDEELLSELAEEFPRATLVEAQGELDEYVWAICAHLSGEHRQMDLPIDVKATEFQQRVWTALRSIPYGETRSYRDVATLIGDPKAVRAVARACATNPVALVVPCHRVVRTGGELSGYRWGVDRKRRLLERERAQ